MTTTEYSEQINTIFNKAIKDELSSAIQYTIQAAKLKGSIESETADELLEHGKEEFSHFTELVDYATKHNFDGKLVIELDFDVIKNISTDLKEIQNFNMKLEKTAADDYKKAAILARENGDLETEAFFIELMQDELSHFDDIAELSGDTRGLNESVVSRMGKFSKLLK